MRFSSRGWERKSTIPAPFPLLKAYTTSHSRTISHRRWEMKMTETPRLLSSADLLEELLDVEVPQGRGRLIQDQETGILQEGLRDLHHLLFLRGQVDDLLLDGDVADVELLKERPGLFLGHAVASEAARTTRDSLPRLMFSQTDSSGTRLRCWWTCTIPCRLASLGDRMTVLVPSIRSVPSSAAVSPEQMRANVVFPEPLAPTRPQIMGPSNGQVNAVESDDAAESFFHARGFKGFHAGSPVPRCKKSACRGMPTFIREKGST